MHIECGLLWKPEEEVNFHNMLCGHFCFTLAFSQPPPTNKNNTSDKHWIFLKEEEKIKKKFNHAFLCYEKQTKKHANWYGVC